MMMGVLPNLAIIAILISNCTSAPNGAISYNSIQYFVNDKFHDSIPEEYIFKTWGYRIEDAVGREHTYKNKVSIPHQRKENLYCTIHRRWEVVKAHYNPTNQGYYYWVSVHKRN